MWFYSQSTGAFTWDGLTIATGYSGWDDGDGVKEPGEGKNDPATQEQRSIGPVPRGQWHIGPAFDHPTKGPAVMQLDPHLGTETFGRSGFLIHGDSIRAPGTASHGCIILPRSLRRLIDASKERNLEVIA